MTPPSTNCALKGRGPPQHAPISVTLAVPPSRPSQVRLGFIAGTITCRVGICAQRYCRASLSCTMSTKKNSRRAPGLRICSWLGLIHRGPVACIFGFLLGRMRGMQRQSGRGVTQAVNADQQPDLDLRRPLEEPLVIARQGNQPRE